MAVKDSGNRIDTLRTIVHAIAKIKTIATIRFVSGGMIAANVTPEKVQKMFEAIRFDGLSMIGTALKRRILEPLLYDRQHPRKKPLLIIVLTDGEVFCLLLSSYHSGLAGKEFC